MKRLSVFVFFLSFISVFAQSVQLKSGSTVYIEPMNGYETYLAAAFAKNHVPLIVVADENKAAYIIRSTLSHTQISQPAVVINNTNGDNNDAYDRGVQMAMADRAARGITSAGISVIDRTSSQLVFAYSVGKDRNTNQVQSAAEACAKHLKEFIEKSEKKK